MNDKRLPALVLYVLEVLKAHSSEEKPLRQMEVVQLLQEDYDLISDRRNVADRLNQLVQMPAYADRIGVGKKGGARAFYYIPEERAAKEPEEEQPKQETAPAREEPSSLLGEEAMTVAAGLLFSPVEGTGDWLEKLKEAAALALPEKPASWESCAPQVLLDCMRAIREGRKISISCKDAAPGKEGRERKGLSPYALVPEGGGWLLVYLPERGEKILRIRLDTVLKVEILEESARELAPEVQEKLWDPMTMITGNPVPAELLVEYRQRHHLVEYFGKEKVQMGGKEGRNIYVSVTADEEAVASYLLRYPQSAKALSPQTLVERMEKTLAILEQQYAPPRPAEVTEEGKAQDFEAPTAPEETAPAEKTSRQDVPQEEAPAGKKEKKKGEKKEGKGKKEKKGKKDKKEKKKRGWKHMFD